MKYTTNTVIITVGAILIDVIFGSLCAYPLACMEFKGKKLIFSLLISAMVIPAAAGMIINFITINALGLMGTYLGVILPGSLKVFTIIFFRQAYLAVPKEMIDAAKIDGAGEIRIWWQIMFPSIKAAVSTIVIFDFIGRWNDFLWPQIVFSYNTDKYPLAAALKWLEGPLAYNTGYIAAGAIMSMIPILILFFLFQKNYIEAISGAVKG